MRVLITGGAGFIGSHLADSLVELGNEVLVIDNFATGRRDNLSEGPKLGLIEATIAEPGVVTKAFEEFRPEQVIHAAAAYKNPDDWLEDSRTNVVGTINIVKASGRVGVHRIIYFQTALCYGLHPLQQPISLDHPLRPGESSYAISKTAAEHYIALSGLDFVSFRLANAYGPRNISGPLPTFYHRLSAGKRCFVMDTRRDFVYISDLVEVVLKAIRGEGKRGFYHVASGRDYAIEELYEEAVKALAVAPSEPVEVRERSADDAYSILLDPSNTEEDFKWRPTISLAEGVRKAVDYYRRFGIEETFTHLRVPRD